LHWFKISCTSGNFLTNKGNVLFMKNPRMYP
jgi:hypothetical protein